MGVLPSTKRKDSKSQREGAGQPPFVAALARPLLTDLHQANEPFIPMLEHRYRLQDTSQLFHRRRWLIRLSEDVITNNLLLPANPAAWG